MLYPKINNNQECVISNGNTRQIHYILKFIWYIICSPILNLISVSKTHTSTKADPYLTLISVFSVALTSTNASHSKLFFVGALHTLPYVKIETEKLHDPLPAQSQCGQALREKGTNNTVNIQYYSKHSI